MIIFCAINIHRNLDWRTSIGFYEQLVTYRPDDYRVINNLGMEYANKGIHDKALATYLKAIALDPKNPVAYHNIAGTYRDTGHIDLALENFQKPLSLIPILFSPTVLWLIYTGVWGNMKNVRKVYCRSCAWTPWTDNIRQGLANGGPKTKALIPCGR